MVARDSKTSQDDEHVGRSRRGRFNSALAVVAVDRQNDKTVTHRSTRRLIQFADIVAGSALAIALYLTVWFFITPSLWFEVRSVQVFDSQVNTSPRMIVDRTIHRPFVGSWVVSVYEVTPEGFERACLATGHADYSVEAQFPSDLTLDWWTWPTQCNLPTGEYVVRTTWTIDLFGVLSKEVRNTSNAFKVTGGLSGQESTETRPTDSDIP